MCYFYLQDSFLLQNNSLGTTQKTSVYFSLKGKEHILAHFYEWQKLPICIWIKFHRVSSFKDLIGRYFEVSMEAEKSTEVIWYTDVENNLITHIHYLNLLTEYK